MPVKRLNLFAGILALLLVLSISVQATFYSPIDQRYIEIGSNPNWFYIKIHKVTGNDYFAFSRTELGHIGIAVDDQYIGYMFFVPAFKHPANSKWYVCPLVDTGSYSLSLQDTSIHVNGSGSYTCYNYNNVSESGTGDITINEFVLAADRDANIKITANVTVTSANPSDTGFAFIFVPSNQNLFRYAKVAGVLQDLTTADRFLTVDKDVEFYTAAQDYIGHRFYWEDMPSATNIMQIVTLGAKKGLLMGTYGYGASDTIYIDPLYSVDYTPEPAQHLINGTVFLYNDTEFQNQINITSGVSDSSDATNYSTFDNVGAIAFEWWNYGAAIVNETDLVQTIDGSYSDITHQWTAPKYAKAVMQTGAFFSGDVLKLYVQPKRNVDKNTTVYITDVTGNVGYGIYNLPNDLVYEWRNLTLENISVSGTNKMYIHDGTYAVSKALYDKVEFDSNNIYLGNAIVGRWNNTYDPAYYWWLRLRKVTAGDSSTRVYAYHMNNSINTTQYVEDSLSGTGWFNINVSSLIDYETNVAGLGYTELRFYSKGLASFSEVLLRREQNDTQSPQIQDCQVDNTHLYYGQFAKFKCNVTDDLDVASVNGTIEGTTYDFVQNNSWYYYDWQCLYPNPSVDWTLVQAEDIIGNLNTTNPAISIICSTNTSMLAVDFNVSDFSFASDSYVSAATNGFNTTASATEFVLLSSFNVEKLSGAGTSVVSGRVLVDDVVLQEENLRTVSTTNGEGSAGFSPFNFTVSAGEHNITYEFKRTGNGTVEINDMDMNLVQLISWHGYPVRTNLNDIDVVVSSTSFQSVFDWLITKVTISSTFVATKLSLTKVGTGSSMVTYAIQDNSTAVFPSNITSPYVQRYLSAAGSIGSTSIAYVCTNPLQVHERDIYARQTDAGDSVEMNGSVLDFDLEDSSHSSINHFMTTNSETNTTLTKSYGAGTHNVANYTATLYNSTAYLVFMSTTFTTTSDAFTPTYYIDAVGVPQATCYSKKERYLSSNSDIGNAFIYTICNNLTSGSSYTFRLQATVPAGETLKQLDESFAGFEVMAYDVSTLNLPPAPNAITNPTANSLHNNTESDYVNWTHFVDPNGDLVTYNVTLLNLDYSYNDTILGSTTNNYAPMDYSAYGLGSFVIMVEGCDPYGLCANSTVYNITIMQYVAPPVPLNITIHSPQNITYNSSLVPLQVTANKIIDTWWYSLNGASNTTFTPNMTIVAAGGSNYLIVYANDTGGNESSADVWFFYNDTTDPIIDIISPTNTTYYTSQVTLNTDSDEPMDTWWYSLNGGANTTFVPATLITVQNGSNYFQVWGNDTSGNEGYDYEYFTYDNTTVNVTGVLELTLYYEPYVTINTQTTIHAVVRLNGTLYPNATVTIQLDGFNASMTWDNYSDSYIVYWIPTVDGTYNFIVEATGSATLFANGTILVDDPFQICISLWTTINMTEGTEYLNEFAWIYAIYSLEDPELKQIFDRDEKLACPPQGQDMCYWHAEYINGTACLDLYLIGNYTFYIVGNNIDWYQDIGSGNVTDCEFCPPVEIQKRLLLPLGDYYVDEEENIDIYVSEHEMYWRGLFYGAISSWLWMGIMFIVAIVAFVGVLWATGSLKSAIAALVILPTIIWLITTFTL